MLNFKQGGVLVSARGRGGGKTPDKVRQLLGDAVSQSSQAAVAKETGLTRQTVQRYLQGIGEPSGATLQKLADYFDVPVYWLRGDFVAEHLDIDGAREWQKWLRMSEEEREELSKKSIEETNLKIEELRKEIHAGNLKIEHNKNRIEKIESNFYKYESLVLEFMKIPPAERVDAIETLMLIDSGPDSSGQTDINPASSD